VNAVQVLQLSKTFHVPVRDEGVVAALVSLFRRRFRDVRAVNDITFSLSPGEVVGFLGPNGAGKTTTLKMLSGLLYPTSGSAQVLGHVPWRREKDYLQQIALLMGNRSQLVWDIPALDSFDLNRAVYRIPHAEFLRRRDEFIDLLDLKEQVHKPVRTLSLGERMKAEFVASLLHYPKVLFLDEPTLGLDVTMQRRIRAFIAEYNRRTGATVLLTSHYMADVVALCRRVIVIHHGRLLFDGDLKALSDQVAVHKTIQVVLDDGDVDLRPYGEVLARDGAKVTLRVAREDVTRVAAQVLRDYPVSDLTIEDPPIEDVIDQVFRAE
jgi:ABC-2 type transport system ATP-binding protein